jgi:hypothetical protein
MCDAGGKRGRRMAPQSQQHEPHFTKDNQVEKVLPKAETTITKVLPKAETTITKVLPKAKTTITKVLTKVAPILVPKHTVAKVLPHQKLLQTLMAESMSVKMQRNKLINK